MHDVATLHTSHVVELTLLSNNVGNEKSRDHTSAVQVVRCGSCDPVPKRSLG